VNALKGIVFGGAVAVSQAFASTFGEVAAAAKAHHRAIDLAEYFGKSQGKLATFAPAICAHTAFFAVYRGNGGETAGWRICHATPSHSHVSWKYDELPDVPPPNSTVRRRAAS
jgi:hypothetical protein